MIEIEDLSIKAGHFRMDGLSMKIEKGKYGLLMGKTGSGKTTLMETICGLKKHLKGKIYLDGEDVSLLRPAERKIGYVPQDGALFSTKNVFENIAFSLNLRKWEKVTIDSRVHELAELFGIEKLLKRKVYHLSGGEKQRVSLARALAFYPKIMCFDESLSALDKKTHTEICHLLKRVQEETHVTFLHISHNSSEENVLADVCYSIEDGRLICI